MGGRITVAEAIARLEADFWQGKVRTGAAQRTWDRIATELHRLPQAGALTIDLLCAVAGTTPAGSRSRLEATKVFKRLALLIGLDGTDRLDALRTPYEPARRELPGDGESIALLEGLEPASTWAWATWALATYGCRPAEVFSLTPADNGTARVLSVKRKGKLPTWRTAMALPLATAPGPRSLPWEVSSPAAYDSLEAQRLVTQWGKWLRRRAPGVALYDLRHSWAIRSIRAAVPTGLAARCMGHDIAVHTRTYHHALGEADVAAFVASRLCG